MTLFGNSKKLIREETSHFHLSFHNCPFFLSFSPIGAIFPTFIAGATGDYSQFRQDHVGSLPPLIHLHAFLFNFSVYFMSLGSLESPRVSNKIDTPLRNRGGHCSRFQRPSMPSKGALALLFFFPGSDGHKNQIFFLVFKLWKSNFSFWNLDNMIFLVDLQVCIG